MTLDANPKPVQTEAVPDTKSDDVAIPDYLRSLLERIAIREGFADGYRIISRSGSKVGDGFIAEMLSVVISGNRNGVADDELVLVCKIPPTNEVRQKMAVDLFNREIASYEKLLPALVEFQREKGIGEDEGFYAFPKCYGTHIDEGKSEFAVVLEDLRPKGFRMWNKYAPIDYQHAKLVFTQLGKFHALSFALRQQRPEVFEEFKSLASGMFKIMTDFPDSTAYHQKNYDRALETLHPDDKGEMQIIRNIRKNFPENFRSAVSAPDAEPFAVFCHGDFWNNNIMFQYNSEDSLEPQQAILIDWQLGQYCSPATDLTYYLYSSTEQQLRTDHFDDLLHDYHESLSDLLERLDGNASQQFSFNDLERQLQTFGIYGLILAPTLIQIVTVKANDLPDMNSLTEDNRTGLDFMLNGSPDGFNVRMRDVVRDFVARGFEGEKQLTD